MGNCCSGDTKVRKEDESSIHILTNSRVSSSGPSIERRVDIKYLYKLLGEDERDLESFQSSIETELK